MLIEYNAPLTKLNTFGFSTNCNVLATVETEAEMAEVLNHPKWQSMSCLILGGGSNILLTGDFNGLVIHNCIRGIEIVSQDSDHVRIRVGSGEVWHAFVMYCVAQGFAGIENLSLIPGTVGAAPMQNIGAYGVEVREVIENVEAIHKINGNLRIFSNEECRFGYRESIFKKELKGQYIITAVSFKLNKTPQYHVEYGDIRKTLEEKGVSELSLKAVSEAIISIRKSKLPDPSEIGNAGSFFKNPEIGTAQFETLRAQFETMPGYPTANGVKVPAGWLIERAGWKGYREGQVGVHDRQALVLVNYGGGTGDQVKELSAKVMRSVQTKFGISLTPEVNFI